MVSHDLLQYVERYNSQSLPNVEKYQKIAKIGEGTFGEVFKGRNKQTGQVVALKKIFVNNQKEGFPITALREIKLLQRMKHENIVQLLETCTSKASSSGTASFYLIFEFCDHDLAGLLSNAQVSFSLGEIKNICFQLLNGLYYLHSQRIVHRDMKTANILLKGGILKLADFGLARTLTKDMQCYTPGVVTRWYRPPELLLGDTNYSTPVDLWGAGCILAEIWTRSPILQGQSEQHQLLLISELCGSITPAVWPGVQFLKLYRMMELPKGINRKVQQRLSAFVVDPLPLDLIDRLLALDPAQRITAEEALRHEFLWSAPPAVDLTYTLSRLSCSMFEYLSSERRMPPRTVNGGPRNGQMQDRIF